MTDNEQDDQYKVPTKVGINDILERDKDDAALDSYKKQLLGTNFYSRMFFLSFSIYVFMLFSF